MRAKHIHTRQKLLNFMHFKLFQSYVDDLVNTEETPELLFCKKKKKAENKFILTNFVKGYKVLDFAKLHI